MVLRVRLPEGDHIVDAGLWRADADGAAAAGVGGRAGNAARPYRLVQVGEEMQLQAKIGGAWEPVYLMSLQEHQPADWEIANWFTSTHPEIRASRGS